MRKRQPIQDDQAVILTIVDALFTYRDKAFAERERQQKIIAHKQKQQGLKKERAPLLAIPGYQLIRKDNETQRLRLIELTNQIEVAKQTLLQLEFSQSRYAPQLSDDVFYMAEVLLHVQLSPIAVRDIRGVLKIQEAQQALASAKQKTRTAKTESRQAEKSQTTSKDQLDAKERSFDKHLLQAQKLVTELRRPFEVTIDEHQKELEKLKTQLVADRKTYQSSTGSAIDDLEIVNAADQEELQGFQKIDIRLKGEVQLLKQSNQQLLTLALPAGDLRQAELRLSDRQTELYQVQQRVTELSQRIAARTKELKPLQKQHTTLQKKLYGLEKDIEQLNTWLAANGFQIPSYPVETGPDCFDWLINNCEVLQRVHQSNAVEKLLRFTSRETKLLAFNADQLGMLKTELLATQSVMREAQECRRDHQQVTRKCEQQQRAQRSIEKKEQQVVQHLDTYHSDLKRYLCERELQQQGLIPEQNIFMTNLDEFERVLAEMVALREEGLELTGRIDTIKKEYDCYVQEYGRQLADISKPYKFSWHLKENYYQQVNIARQNLVVKLTTLINPNLAANARLRTHPQVFSRLSRLNQIATILLSCLVVGLPLGIYRLYQHNRACKIERAFDAVSNTASQIQPIDCSA